MNIRNHPNLTEFAQPSLYLAQTLQPYYCLTERTRYMCVFLQPTWKLEKYVWMYISTEQAAKKRKVPNLYLYIVQVALSIVRVSISSL